MSKFNAGKASVLALTLAFAVVSFFLGRILTVNVMATPPGSSTPTPTSTPSTVHVIVCHKDGGSGNYSRIDVSVHSVNDSNGLSGHGDHSNDIWAPFTFNSVNYSGQGNYSNFNFDNCHQNSTPTPTPTPTPFHYACSDNHHCIRVSGSGSNSCTDNDDCETNHTPTPTPTVTPTITPTATPVPTTPLNCTGDQHPDASGQNCVSFTPAGPPPEGPYTPPQGQVLGASTMAGTGSFAENLYIAIMGLGGIITALGIKNFKKGYKVV